MTGDYERNTRTLTVAELPAPLASELERVGSAQGVPDVRGMDAVETHSRRLRKPGLLARMVGVGDADVEHWTAVVLTRSAVLVGVHGEKRGTRVFFLPLQTLELGDGLGGAGLSFKSPSIGGTEGAVASYTVFLADDAAKGALHARLLAALAELRA
ncbi:MAG: hypothetical protein H6725_07075 [Sandaracinaceae bacterium]|nr:hypothetical protein [Sandaracinaceae bacterium]